MQAEFVIRKILSGDFRFLLIFEMQRLLIAARQEKELAQGGEYVGRDVTFLIRRLSLDEAIGQLEKTAEAAVVAVPAMAHAASLVAELAPKVRSAPDATALLALAEELFQRFELPTSPSGDDSIVLSADRNAVSVRLQKEGSHAPADMLGAGPVDQAVHVAHEESRFLAAVALLAASARRDNRRLTGHERTALAAGYHAIELGAAMPRAFLAIATSGFRAHQTSLSLADPGDGHMSVTCLSEALLDGTIVHVEHIDRSESNDRESVEAYRLPSFVNASRVRLQAGVAAPCTAYIGRALFENGVVPADGQSALLAREFERDILKSAHMTSGACTAMFATGIADCKVAMERMTATQLIQFMRAVAGNVIRDVSRQFLSAAFNINVPILDDRDSTRVQWVTGKFSIASLAIDLAIAGQFEKVTWDGASNLAKSDPIIREFSHAQWTTLIHRAHENGLETYVSAGMDVSHMPECVHAGVDGVGIGTSLHYRKAGRPMGQLKPDAIQDVLRARDAAAASVPGQAATLLAGLDRLAFERILPATLEAQRQVLFEALRDVVGGAEASLAATIEAINKTGFWKAMDTLRLRSFQLHPVVARAERALLAASLGDDLQLEFRTTARVQGNDALRRALAAGDITELMEIMR